MAYKKLHPNGRDKGKKGAMSQVPTEMQESAAFATLNASSIRVLLFAIFLNYYAATRTTGRPVFKFTNKTAKDKLGMNQQTFTRAKRELADKGFWKWVKRGGLGGGATGQLQSSHCWVSGRPGHQPQNRRQVTST